MNDPQFDDDWNEPSDDDRKAAIAELADDPGALWDVLTESSWWKEHALALYAASEEFRNEVERERKDWIDVRAQEIADGAAASRAEEAELDRLFSIKESRDDR